MMLIESKELSISLEWFIRIPYFV